MTSTHLDPGPSHAAVPASANSVLDPTSTASLDDSASADSSFSDAYKEQDDGKQKNVDVIISRSAEDDYAMTFESDGEENSDSQDISQANIEQERTSLSAPVPIGSDLPSSIIPNDPNTMPGSFQTGQDFQSTHNSPPPTLPSVADVATANLSDILPAQSPADTTVSHIPAYEDVTSGGIDIQQLLDNITANAEKNEASTVASPSSVNAPKSSLPKSSSALPAHASLPPRPQLPQKPPKRANFPEDTQKYLSGGQSFPQSSNSYRPPGVAPSFIAAGAPGTSTDPRTGLPPPPSASFRQPPLSTASPISPISSALNQVSTRDQPSKSIERSDDVDDADRPWGSAVQKIYDEFLAEERINVTEGLWDRFPVGSRLFIGNLPTEKVTKRDLFHIFHKYGKLAQVSIKQAYGFIQFHDSAACYRALDLEQGQEVRGRKMHLEISKPQKNTRNQQVVTGMAPLRRSRSPDYQRGGISDRGRYGQPGGRGVDRYDGRSAPLSRDGDYGRRVRDDYRPGRSPSPTRGNFRGRDDFAFSRGRDSYDGRDRRRSRSRSPPYGHRDEGRYRERSLSPRVREANEDAELQIPRRDPRDIPDVQVILMDQLDRGFVSWVEGELRGRGIKPEIMFLSPRLPLQAVIRRQILEGVLAVSQLDIRSQNSSRIPLQVFDRQGGANNVRFDEYQDLEPKIAAELVLRAKQTQLPTPGYTQPQFASGQSYQLPPAAPPAPAAANLASLVGQLDNATLQKLLGSLNTPQQQQNAPAAAANSSIDLAGLIGGLQHQPSQQSYHPQPPVADPYANLAGNSALASLLGNNAPQQSQAAPQQSAQQVQNIMAQLAKFRQ